ncbi:hypothetical protein BGM26_07505 [Bacillus sp. FJAT-29790]|uniref:hypothetical protein n=1 Tax=Bacillus sp. FJAT-29790 TaxID=1895002 RepID=UPI001C24FC0B|nr:hypothetical protein [Bacillus sp. FJAT-29790]MBU8878831.1 hypothetical protein [Bacillus sp. FJAT-29790]
MINKFYLFALTIMAGIIALTGCSNNTDGSYAGILIVDGKEYILQGDIENNEFTIGDKIGEVKKTVDADVYPKDNLSSNLLIRPAGTTLECCS